jgi:hypothetical protein
MTDEKGWKEIGTLKSREFGPKMRRNDERCLRIVKAAHKPKELTTTTANGRGGHRLPNKKASFRKGQRRE